MSQPIAPEVLAAPVAGRNLRPGTLGDQWGDGPALLVFPRHLGCPFTREWVAELRQAVAADRDYPPPLFVHLGGVEDGAAFFEQFAPEARTVADPDERLFRAFGLGRGGLLKLFGPEVIACGLRATFKGHHSGRIVGDPWMLPGAFLVGGDRILWSYRARHAGSRPNFARIPELAAAGQPG